jgi:hypothetical protein
VSAIVVHVWVEAAPHGHVVAQRSTDACRAGAWAAQVREAAHRELDAAIDAALADCEATEHGCVCALRKAA